MEVKVSIIIPVYGVELFLERAVDSALGQTLAEKEIILVDDGSPDACPEICERYAREHPGLVRVLHQENQGLGMARNAGAALAQGEYLLFLDSDDTIQPEMAQALYEKAKAGDCDLVMCDVRILYVEENREVVVASYPREEVDLADYIAHGNNITYSVNKLFRRSIWQENRYEKMLFEDIALIPALVTRCRRVGYVPQAFYNYYRRGGTISTTQTGDMVDIVKAFRKFLLTCHPAYRQEAVYSTARQLLWNMTQSRPLFLPDFIGLLHEFEADFRLNPYLKEDRETAKLLGYLDTPVVPDVLICAHCRRELPPELREAIGRHFPLAEVLEPGESWLEREEVPEHLRQAAEQGRWQYVKEPPHGALLLRLRRWGEPFHLVLWGLAAALCGAGAAGLLPGGPHLQPGLPAPGGAAAGFPHHPLWLSDERPPPNPGGRHCPPAQRAVLRLPRRGELLQTKPPRPRGL